MTGRTVNEEGLELARKLNERLAELRADLEALQAASSVAWGSITDKPAAVTALTGTNTGDQDLSGLAPISTTVTLGTSQTITGIKVFSQTPTFGDGATVDGDLVCNGSIYGGGAFITNISGSNITAGNIPVARIATALTTPGPIGGTTPAAVNATTVTASGAVSISGDTYVTGTNKKVGTSINATTYCAITSGGILSIFQFPNTKKFGIQAATSVTDDGGTAGSYSQMSFGSTKNTMFGAMGASQADPGFRVHVDGTFNVTGASTVTNLTASGTVTFVPAASATPASNGQLTFEATSNTSLTVKLRGTDGTVRSVVLTLAP